MLGLLLKCLDLDCGCLGSWAGCTNRGHKVIVAAKFYRVAHLIFVNHHYRTGFMSLIWHLKFW